MISFSTGFIIHWICFSAHLEDHGVLGLEVGRLQRVGEQPVGEGLLDRLLRGEDLVPQPAVVLAGEEGVEEKEEMVAGEKVEVGEEVVEVMEEHTLGRIGR